jgi:hypothetical protein
MNLEFRNNQSFVLSLNISGWSNIYPLEVCDFLMHIRDQWDSVAIVYTFSSFGIGNGTLFYNGTTKLLDFYAPMPDMLGLAPGTYQYDLRLKYLDMYKDLTGGSIIIDGGITK